MAASIIQGVTPWQNHKEWELVYKELYSGDRKLQQHALDKMGMWWCRYGDKLSSGIISSYELLGSMLSEKDCDIQRRDLSLALVRFVNFVTDKKQNKVFASNIVGIGKKLGIPEWMVEMRHSAVHQGGLPSIRMLKHGAKFALKWLQKNYWEAQTKGIEEDNQSEVKKLKLVKRHEQILMEYMQEQFNAIQNEDVNEDDPIPLILDKFCSLAEDNVDIAMDLLCQVGYLIPTDEQLGSLGIVLSHKEIITPESLANLWKPLLNSIDRMNLTVTLLEHLADLELEENSAEENIAMSWISHILITYGSKDDTEKTDSKISVNVHDVILKLVDKPNKYSPSLLEQAWSFEHHFTKEQQTELTKLINLVNHIGLPEVTKEETNGKIYYASDFKAAKRIVHKAEKDASDKMILAPEELQYDSNRSCNGWQKADASVPWGRYPIGTCPAYMDSNTYSLELYEVYPNSQSEQKGISVEESDFEKSDDDCYDGVEEDDEIEQEEKESRMDIDTESEVLELQVPEKANDENVSVLKEWTKVEMKKLKSSLVVL